MNDSTTFRRVPVYAFRRESDDFLAGVIGSPTSAIDNCQSFVTTARKYIRGRWCTVPVGQQAGCVHTISSFVSPIGFHRWWLFVVGAHTRRTTMYFRFNTCHRFIPCNRIFQARLRSFQSFAALRSDNIRSTYRLPSFLSTRSRSRGSRVKERFSPLERRRRFSFNGTVQFTPRSLITFIHFSTRPSLGVLIKLRGAPLCICICIYIYKYIHTYIPRPEARFIWSVAGLLIVAVTVQSSLINIIAL